MKLAKPVVRRLATFSKSLKPERITKERTSIDAIKELHAYLIRTQLQTDPYAISPVIRSYALSPSHFHKAHIVFDQIKQPTLLIWNYMIRGLSLSDKPYEAIQMYYSLCQRGLFGVGDNLALIFVLKACARVSDIVVGQEIHARSVKLGFESYLFLSNAFIHMYACCGDVTAARKVFDGMRERDVVSWNSIICGYSHCNMFSEILGLFNSMQEANVEADAVTMVKIILACIRLGKQDIADSMIKYIKQCQIEIDVYLGNTLIDMYGRRGSVDLARKVFDSVKGRNMVSWNAMIAGYMKAGNFTEARKLFDGMPVRDVISWTAMITGYSQTSQFLDAVELFKEMMKAKVRADNITVASVLSACSHLGSLDMGETVHEYIHTYGVEADIYVGNALIDMYCKCGEIGKAMLVFTEMKERDSVSWTSVISGLAVNGFAGPALGLFSLMLKEGVKPTHGVFVGILLACAHAGLVDKGLDLLQSMAKVYGLIPEMKHYGCVVDLLSRSGNLDRAYEFIKTMPVEPNVVLWRILLHSCKLHGNVHLAEVATKKLLESDASNSGNYVLLSDTYAGSNRWDDATNVRETMAESKVDKPIAWSSIEGKGIFSISK